MDRNEHLSAILTEGRALISAAEGTPDGLVSACPGWTNTELLDHIRMVWGFVATQVRAADTSGPSRPNLSDSDSPADLLDDLLSLLESTDADNPAWNWSPDMTTGFWVRRMACEAAIHRWDAEDAAGTATPIEHDLAVDVVDEA
ncbi:MAG: maleylpyruvate isomerase family mycothiol-dependent enzyme, partial [Acidimicrobiales bacterium]|nr:maleylpyruvate isomerase family mycothiol-dependent enzyme [Acidimicrobiales bacterium]